MWIATENNKLVNLDYVSLLGTSRTYSETLPKYEIYAYLIGCDQSESLAYFNDNEEGRAKMKVLTDAIGKENIIRFEKK